MPIIEPIDRSEAEEQGLGAVMDSFARLGDPDAVFPRILAHVPGYAEALWGAMSESLMEGGVDLRLKEIMRIQLAQMAEDPYFVGLRSRPAADAGLTDDLIEAAADFEHDARFTEAERWALRYAHLMYRRPDQVDQAFYDEGKRHFSEAQIMEMGGMIAVHYGMQVFMRTLAED